jgi:RimJ/RimL family protein N-acetyltransferase/uncharacterized protein YndB with AHSA1/START domain
VAPRELAVPVTGRIDAATRWIRADPARVYRAFGDPAALAAWLPPDGMTGSVLEFAFREGGGYRMRLSYDRPGHRRGKTSEDADEVEVGLVELVPDRRIVQVVTFESERPEFAGSMRMTWAFIEADGGTRVSVRCEDVPAGIRPEDHEAGLASSLANLARFVERGREGTPDSVRELRGRRLVLRPVGPGDGPALQRHWSEPEVRRHLWDGRVVSPGQVREAIAVSARLFDDHGTGLWTIEAVEATGLIGCAGFWHFHEPPELELLISLSPRLWGGGFAHEAAALLLDYVFDELGWAAVQASADAPNARSLQLMRRLGMRPAGERPGEFGAIEVYRITAAEWRVRGRDGGGQAGRGAADRG